MTRPSLVALALALGLATGCFRPTPYQRTTQEWTRKAKVRSLYQEAMQLAAVYKSPAWRLAHAEKDAEARGLAGAARDQRLAQAQTDAAGPIELELIVTTWDRRENDLERGEKSAWRVRLLDDSGAEIAPLEIVKDKRPMLTLRAEFPAMGDFSTAYIARFPKKGDPQTIRLRVSGERGGVTLEWPAR